MPKSVPLSIKLPLASTEVRRIAISKFLLSILLHFILLLTIYLAITHSLPIARLLSKLSRFDDATHTWRALIDQNPDSHEYYRGYLGVKGIDLDALTLETRDQALAVFSEFGAQLPRAAAPRRLALEVSKGGWSSFKSSSLLTHFVNLFRGQVQSARPALPSQWPH